MKKKPNVTFGQVSGYDNPLVKTCTYKKCVGQACEFWEKCGMKNRVLILEG